MCSTCYGTIIRWASDARQAKPTQQELAELYEIAKWVEPGSRFHLDVTGTHNPNEYVRLPKSMVVSTYEQLMDELKVNTRA